MTSTFFDLKAARQQWHPVASSDDLVPRHVYHAKLLGRELAIWRADDGFVNVWENRCLHRGVRLSIGVNDGRELMCQYHGWRYANRTAGCTYIPAHPADSPARTICNQTYPVIEKQGLIWTTDERTLIQPDSSALHGFDHQQLVLRPIPVNASVDGIADQFKHYSEFLLPSEVAGRVAGTDRLHHCHVQLRIGEHPQPVTLNVWLQPVDSLHTVIRGTVSGLSAVSNVMDHLRAHNNAMQRLRDSAEDLAADEHSEPWEALISPVSQTISHLPELTVKSAGVSGALRVEVEEIKHTAVDVKSITLKAIDTPLPTFQPGAHIDIQLPNALIRQYSLTNGPGETDRYVIGVKREENSTGGSAFIHDSLKAGDVVIVSAPRNNFPLRRDALRTVLIAGGIGVTPLLSMARALQAMSLPVELHYFVQSQEHRAFSNVLDELGDIVSTCTGLNPTQTGDRIAELLGDYKAAQHVYICGPAPMLNAARQVAATQQWPDDAVHFEYFKNTLTIDHGKAFSVSLARSGLTLEVPSGDTLLSVLRQNGVELPSSCEQGACGTCRVDVIDGVPLHQDVHLSEDEKKRGDCLMTCVSRALGDSLTLDI